MTDDKFTEFWAAYPLKEGKKPAEDKYWRARKNTSHEAIMEGLERYKRCKPDWQGWAHAKTWLYNRRWEDESEEEAKTYKREAFDLPPAKAYLRQRNAPPKRPPLTAEQKALSKMKHEIWDELKRQGKDPAQVLTVPEWNEEARRRLSQRQRKEA